MKFPPVFALTLILATGTAHAQQRAATPAAPAVSPVINQAAPAQTLPPNSPNELDCRVLTGRVTDAMNHPLMGATIMLRSRSKGFNADAFITNAEGQYIVTSKQPIPRNTVLEISAGGYNTYVLPLENCRPVDAALEPLPGTRFKSDGRIKKTSATGKIH
ncbi:carboxypeptidase-like regulatory domain-containing protein [Hymenobacter daeguensis]